MTGVVRLTGATSNLGRHWKAINWPKVKAEVKRLQMRIAKAGREGRLSKVKSLQWILSHSYCAKLLAVKSVTSNKGGRTAGVDGVIWNTPARKMRGVLSLIRRGYRVKPLRRVLIPKKDGRKRPLGIPTIKDRAMQMLYLLTLAPVAESTADHNSYGFRFYRACRDAIGQCFCALAKSYSPKWILDADIKACFDWIDHGWLLNNIMTDKKVLRQWLKCGYFQDGKLFPTKAGTPQGGIISPTLANMTLDGLEETVRKSCPRRSKVNFIRYVDDFMVTASKKRLLENKVIPAINEFLKPRGLMLSSEKTRVVRIEEGVDFLSQNLRKYRNKLIISPAKEKTKSFLDKVCDIIRKSYGWSSKDLIKILNPIIRGFANYHRYVQSSRVFSHADTVIFQSLMRWARRRHPQKGYGWIIKKHFNHPKRKWAFSCIIKDRSGNKKLLELIKPSYIKLVRYIKIKGEANPFNPEYSNYFNMRKRLSNTCPI